MKYELPKWALRQAKFEDREELRDQFRRGTLRVEWPDRKTLKRWASQRGWPTPWLGFEKSFIGKMLENESNFDAAFRLAGIEISVPTEERVIDAARIKEFDALYGARSPEGFATEWDYLVEELREIRRAIDAGVAVEIEGRVFKRSGSFLIWAHERYHALEDGSDRWIGNDDA